MSYPRQVQPLVIEDEPRPKAFYERVFTDLQQSGLPILEPRFAFSYEDAVKELRSERPYHLVVLDLCLPERPGIPAEEGNISYGESLLTVCIERDDFPIPSLLVITGFAPRTDQSQLRSTIKREFAYGELLVKGDETHREIERAVKRVLAYLDVGFHVRDGGRGEWPTITPREEDLIRRAVIERDAAGVDLAWWSARCTSHAGWTKTLRGNFLLAKGRGRSRINFFKLVTGGDGARLMDQDVCLLESKLPHIKRTAFVPGRSRSLLITEKTGDGAEAPESLDRYLSRPADEVASVVPALARELVSQLRSLGDAGVQMRAPRDLLWRCHDPAVLVAVRQRHRPARCASELDTLRSDPLALFEALRSLERTVRYEERDCTHGDMNVTNVAIDLSPAGPRAYVFDAAGVGKAPALRDLASLEVSALLLVPADVDGSLVEACAAELYGDASQGPQESRGRRTDRATNTIAFIRALRAQAAPSDMYALAVFDQSLMQLGGLAYSGNRVSRFADAVLLAECTAGWFRRVVGNDWGLAREQAVTLPAGS